MFDTACESKLSPSSIKYSFLLQYQFSQAAPIIRLQRIIGVCVPQIDMDA